MNRSYCINIRHVDKNQRDYKKMKTDSGKITDNLISFLNFLMSFCHMDLRNEAKIINKKSRGP